MPAWANLTYISFPPTAEVGDDVVVRVGVRNEGTEAGRVEAEVALWLPSGQPAYYYAAPQWQWAEPGQEAVFDIPFRIFATDDNKITFWIFLYWSIGQGWVNSYLSIPYVITIVTVPPPVTVKADFDWIQTAPLTVRITDKSALDHNIPHSIVFSMGDGQEKRILVDGSSFDHVYTSAGTYTVVLTVSAGVVQDTMTRIVTVTGEPPITVPKSSWIIPVVIGAGLLGLYYIGRKRLKHG